MRYFTILIFTTLWAIAMLKYGINNIGLMFENNLQFLKQFHE